jgi:DNA-binding CsgD family transcriptional regulator
VAEQVTRCHELAVATGDASLIRESAVALADAMQERGDRDAARAIIEREYRFWNERDEPAAAELLATLAWFDFDAGRWDDAAGRAARALETNLQYGLDVPWNHLPVAVIAAHRGELETAREHSGLALRLAEKQFGRRTPVLLATQGVVAFFGGDLREAADRFAEAAEVTARLGWRNPGHLWWVPDHVETLLALGAEQAAVDVLDRWESEAARTGSEVSRAHALRCRGLVAAHQGRLDDALGLLERSVEQHERAQDTFGHARALLALGKVRRRQRQKRGARAAIAEALAEFEQLGARTWVDSAAVELGRIGGRTRQEGLTAAERRVAVLVAQGRTNREVAAALVLGERTVETHLTHVYAKLGVRSRAELARTFRPGEQSSGELTIHQ